jgi:hypothetical protein
MLMKKITSLVFLALTATVAHADIIYSNVDGSHPFSTTTGSFVSSGGTDYSLSFQFAVNDHSYLVDSISFGAFLANADETNAIQATIYADNGGLPGTVLYTGAEIDGLLVLKLAANVNDQDLIIQAVNQPVYLTAGSLYWLGLDNVSDSSDITWGNNSEGINGLAALNQSGSWASTHKTQGAFEIDGTIAAPEPVSMGLFVSGVSALVLLRRKLKA